MSVENVEWDNVVEREWQYEGLDCLVVMVRNGSHRCGYVRIPTPHLLFGMDHRLIRGIEVHGGLSYGYDLDKIGQQGWWIGFDCAHVGDMTNYFPALPVYNRLMSGPYAHWWTEQDVASEVEHMARQVNALQPAMPLFQLDEHQ